MLVDEAAGRLDGRLPQELGHAERQAGADPGAQRPQRDEVRGLLGLGGLRGRDAHEELAAVLRREERGVEVARAAGREGVLRTTSSPATAEVANAARVRWDLAMPYRLGRREPSVSPRHALPAPHAHRGRITTDDVPPSARPPSKSIGHPCSTASSPACPCPARASTATACTATRRPCSTSSGRIPPRASSRCTATARSAPPPTAGPRSSSSRSTACRPATIRIYLGRTTVAHEGEPVGTPVVAAVLTDAAAALELAPGEERWIELRTAAVQLDDRDAALFTTALATANWHASHPFSPRTGEPTVVEQGGWVRRAPSDGSQVFPRTDAAVIMGVVDQDDRLLLGANAMWGGDRYSLLAGFVEPGESFEAAVKREVLEESGVTVEDPALPRQPAVAVPRVRHGRLPRAGLRDERAGDAGRHRDHRPALVQPRGAARRRSARSRCPARRPSRAPSSRSGTADPLEDGEREW
ncbi:NAD(+) diphosphatase [Clavibacter zhangzhiyongii]|uniref:NAD(+) diphosphatase n=1 Tax=Clavibacter zhangzhiyongii TaxID=2768071 RepID=UPI0039DFBE47